MQPENKMDVVALAADEKLTEEDIVILNEAVELVLANYSAVQEIMTRMYFHDHRQLAMRYYKEGYLIQWFVEDENDVKYASPQVLALCRHEKDSIKMHARMLIRDRLFDRHDAEFENEWLQKHPVMLNAEDTADDRHPFFQCISSHKDIDQPISESMTPSVTALLARTCREGRDFHHQITRQHIQAAVKGNRVYYVVPKQLINRYKELTPDFIKSVCDALPNDLLIFTSKIDARLYASRHYLSDQQYPIFSLVLPGQHVPTPTVMRITEGWTRGDVLKCSAVHKRDCIILACEIFNTILHPELHGSLSFASQEIFCVTPFDHPELPTISSKRQTRWIWHKKFMSSLPNPAEPTLQDVCNWLIGYCSYYLDHKGEKGHEKAEQIRELVRLTHRSYLAQDIQGFLEHFPPGRDQSLKDLINHRRNGKNEKWSWGWKVIEACFLDKTEAPPPRLGCGY